MSFYISGERILTEKDFDQGYRYGENLLKGTSFNSLQDFLAQGFNSSAKNDPERLKCESQRLILIANSGQSEDVSAFLNLAQFKDVTVSFEVVEISGAMSVVVSNTTKGKITEQVKSNGGRFELHFVPAQTTVPFWLKTDGSFAIKTLKLEYGTHATVWTPSPADFS